MIQGDIVTRKSYGEDVYFRIQHVQGQQALLRGAEYRLLADAPMFDLVHSSNSSNGLRDAFMSPWYLHAHPVLERIYQERHKSLASLLQVRNVPYFEAPGKVLHIDGDPLYLRKCMYLYKQLQVPAQGFYIPESQISDALMPLLHHIKPNILVITGHDGILKHAYGSNLNQLEHYKNSYHFVQAVQMARQYERHLDQLTIIAGACQSHFEALLEAGANFASSPGRIFIHALDPMCIASKMAYTSIHDTISMIDMYDLTVTGIHGLGGLESKGSYRLGIPYINHCVV
jgi:spore coat assembly protein